MSAVVINESEFSECGRKLYPRTMELNEQAGAVLEEVWPATLRHE